MTFASHNMHCHCNTHMSKDHRQSPLKALLNTFGMHHKAHTMTRYGSQDTEGVPATQDSASLDLAPPEKNMSNGDSESSDEYC